MEVMDLIIDLAVEREKRASKTKDPEFEMVPIVEKIYEIDGEMKFEISGYKKTPIEWLDD